jgi:hypothetical protein
MNHASLAIGAILTVTLIGTIGVNIGIQSAAAQATDIENSETNFIFKQKLANDCSGNATCANTATETFGGVSGLPIPTPVG